MDLFDDLEGSMSELMINHCPSMSKQKGIEYGQKLSRQSVEYFKEKE